jgi:hypothetical protein
MATTPEGKAISSQNAVQTGLFASRDFIYEHEDAEYTQTLDALRREVRPDGVLESSLFAEIMSATWRLRRCRLLEFEGALDDKSLDRARSHAQNSLRRALAELRKIQTERATRELIDAQLPGLADCRQALAAVKLQEDMNAQAHSRRKRLAGLSETGAPAAAPIQPPSSFCKTSEPAPQTPRNALCPCRSGQKFKRCCGRNAPAVLTASQNPALRQAA